MRVSRSVVGLKLCLSVASRRIFGVGKGGEGLQEKPTLLFLQVLEALPITADDLYSVRTAHGTLADSLQELAMNQVGVTLIQNLRTVSVRWLVWILLR